MMAYGIAFFAVAFLAVLCLLKTISASNAPDDTEQE